MSFSKYNAAFQNPFAITPSDTVNFSRATHGGIYVGGFGDIVAVLHDGSTVTFADATLGSVVPVEAIRVNATGTTATDLVGLT